MANILYGVNGEGSGHSTRAKEMIKHLQSQGHSVHVASFDRGLRNLKSEFDVTEIYGLRLAYVRNRVRYRKTIFGNLLKAPRAAKSIKQLTRLAEEWEIDLVVTDFEPLTCHLAHRARLPVISIDNQHLLTRAEISYPRECRKDAAAAKLVTRFMTHGCDAYLVVSFFEAPLRRRDTFLFPPILRQEVLQARASSGDYVLVYVTSPSAELTELLKRIRQRFVCYGFEGEGEEGNLVFRKPSLDGFLTDLAGCKAVLANSGFSLISEALHLRKPYLAWPLKRQFEQVFNAYYIHKMGYGAYWDDLNKERIESFLFNLNEYRENLRSYPAQDNSRIFGKLDELVANCGTKAMGKRAGSG
ncbi:MAG TPA: MJ1255/VC2487 family glycosyltransferase [Terriglobales bacterium]|nr:MJ1255/VC2487 family glycosyltransferase [Terriglobales bacterium]